MIELYAIAIDADAIGRAIGYAIEQPGDFDVIDTTLPEGEGILKNRNQAWIKIRNGCAKQPLDSPVKPFCLLFLPIFAAALQSALIKCPSQVRYNPRLTRLPENW